MRYEYVFFMILAITLSMLSLIINYLEKVLFRLILRYTCITYIVLKVEEKMD
jgi:hypothetical protein